MKPHIAALILIVASGLAFAQDSSNPREQLKQYVSDLQKAPDDQGLREKIIKLALTLNPKLATPEEAERHMVRGAAAIKDAKNEQDYKDAVLEFKQATLAAPWLANAYYNLGIAQSKAGDYGSAARSLKLYVLAAPDAPDAKEAKDLMYEMEYKQEKAAKEAEAKADERRRQEEAAREAARRRAEEEQARATSLEGDWINTRYGTMTAGLPNLVFSIRHSSGGWTALYRYSDQDNSGGPMTVMSVAGRHIEMSAYDSNTNEWGPVVLDLSSDGTEVTGYWTSRARNGSTSTINLAFRRKD